MPSLIESSFVLFVGLVAFAGLLGVGAWLTARLLVYRQSQAEAAGTAGRRWGGRDYERVRHKYFEKERRIRAQRARSRQRDQTRDASPPPANGVPGPVNLDRLHGETLGLEGAVTPQRIREAYKDRVREYHPDQVARLGVKLRALAEEETKRINEAYAYFRKRYGF